MEEEKSSTKEPLTIFNKGWTFKIEVIINWVQFGLQDANSPIIEELIFLHDFIYLILIFIILFIRYIIISILLNNYIYKRDKQSSSNTSPKKQMCCPPIYPPSDPCMYPPVLGDVPKGTKPNSNKDLKNHRKILRKNNIYIS